MSPIEARGLHRFYRRGGSEVAALLDVSLTCAPGETLAVTGPSGSGKSTLLSLLAGLDNPDGGAVHVVGERLSHRSPRATAQLRGRHIGILTQNSGLLGHLTVLDNVRLAARLRQGGGPPPEQLLEELGLTHVRKSIPRTLSGGETARAGLAVALAGSPSVLLADEPTAEVSREEESAVLDLIDRHRPASGATVIVTHSSQVAEHADRDHPPRRRAGRVILAATGLSMVFGGRTVLHNFSVSLDAGERCALTGRSGSGKTTLLLVLAGLLAPSEGTVELAVAARDVVYVPQAPSLVPELTAVQNASLGLRVRGVGPLDAERGARQALRALGLDDADDALPAELSGGMQQRVALARALAVAPALLLVDEPTGALDQATGQTAIDVLLQSAAAHNMTLIVATHDPHVAEQFPRRLVIEQELVR